jgi:hypothetical protein
MSAADDAVDGPSFDPDAVDVEQLDHDFRGALRTGDPGALQVVGYGEISLAFAWPPDRPTVVAKSLPPFEGQRRLEAYVALLDEYLDTLRERRVEPVPTAVRAIDDGARHRAYVLQPALPPETIASAVLRRAAPDDGEGLLAAIVEAVLRASDERVGIDGQVSNWTVAEGRLRFLDVSTPMLRTASGRDRLDTGIFLAAFPWITRRLLDRFVVPTVLDDYHQPRRVVLDTAGNLIRERLVPWIPVLLQLANPHLDRPLTIEEVRRFYRGNARLWSSVQVLRRADRAWQWYVRRREYPQILPPSYQR